MGAADLMPPPEGVNHMRAGGLATMLGQVVRRLSDTQVAGFQGEVPGWIGEAADAYTESIRALGGKVRGIAGAIGVCASHLEEWSVQVGDVTVRVVPELHERYEEAQAEYQRRVQMITDELLDPEDPMTQAEYDRKVDEFAAERIAAQDEVLADYKRVMTELDDLAARVAAAMQAVLDQEIGVEGWTEGGGSRAELASLFFDDIPLVDGQTEYEFAREQAREAADYFDDHETVDADRVVEFYDRYKDRFDDPYFMTALNEYVSPEQILQFLSDADHMRCGPIEEFGTAVARPEYQKAVEELAAGLGYMFVLSSGGIDAGADPKLWETYQMARPGLRTSGGLTLDELWQQRAEEWKAAGNGQLDLYRFNNAHSGSGALMYQMDRGYEYLGLMMAAAGKAHPGLALGPGFFDESEDGRSIPEDLLIFEKKYYSEVEEGLRSPDSLLPEIEVDGKWVRAGFVEGMFSLMDAPVVPEYGPARVPQSWPGFEKADAERFDAVQQFLTGEPPEELGVPGNKKDPMTIIRYLTGHRWSPYHIAPDGGNALGKLLSELSVPHAKPGDLEGEEAYNQWTERSYLGAKIAAEFFEGYQDGLERSEILGVNGRHPFGDSNKALRNWAGRIIAPYLSGIAEGIPVNLGEGEGVDVVEDPHRGFKLSLSSEFLEKLRKEHGVFKDLALDSRIDIHGTSSDPYDDVSPHVNPPAMEVLLAEGMRQYDDDLDWALSAEKNRKSKVEVVISDWAAMLELLDASTTDAEVAQGEAKDEMNRRVKSLASAIIGGVKLGELATTDKQLQGEVDKGFQAISAGALEGIFSEDAAAKAAAQGKERHNSLEHAMKQILLSKFYEGGKLDDNDLNGFKEYAAKQEVKENVPSQIPDTYFELEGSGEQGKLHKAFEGYLESREGIGEDYKLLLVRVDEMLNTAQQEGAEEK
ncbi:MAG: hypothetical protein Q4D89_09175 [Arachnia propionica]|uniref:hypothetical protein n=1 Tax=Arachnia propionica TaxID=1750 RepID=UPI0027055BB8|nr:hypothetical protein [Arachnia propionica]